MNKTFEASYTLRLKEYQTLIQNSTTLDETTRYKDEMNEYMLHCIPFLIESNALAEREIQEDENVNTLFNKSESSMVQKKLFDEYRDVIDDVQQLTDVRELYVTDWTKCCPICKDDDIYVDKSFNCCRECGFTEAYLDDTQGTYQEQQDRASNQQYFPYSRDNHCREWINQFQGQEKTNIPDEVLEQLRGEFKKQRLTNIDQITHQKVRKMLKKLKLNKYYEHVPYITHAITGNLPPLMDIELEDRLLQMFKTIQRPFTQVKPPDRKNFLSYSYVLYKFCELLGEDVYLPYFPLLKSIDKRRQHDVIWKNICAILEWEYIPTA